MFVYKIIDKDGNFVKTYSNRKIWSKLGWLNHAYTANRYKDCTIVEYELVETGNKKSVTDYRRDGIL